MSLNEYIHEMRECCCASLISFSFTTTNTVNPDHLFEHTGPGLCPWPRLAEYGSLAKYKVRRQIL